MSRKPARKDLIREKGDPGADPEKDISYIFEETTVSTARVFMSGSSQAVRLPKAFRFDSDIVSIRREGDEVILGPMKARPWPRGYWRSFGPVGEDFQVPEPLPRSPRRDKLLEDL